MRQSAFSLKWCSDFANIICKGAVQSYYKRKLWCTFGRIAVTARLTGHDNCVIVRCRTRSVRYSCWFKVYVTHANASYTSFDVLRTPLSPKGESFKSCRLISPPILRGKKLWHFAELVRLLLWGEAVIVRWLVRCRTHSVRYFQNTKKISKIPWQGLRGVVEYRQLNTESSRRDKKQCRQKCWVGAQHLLISMCSNHINTHRNSGTDIVSEIISYFPDIFKRFTIFRCKNFL